MPLNLSSKHTTDLLPLSGHICFPTCQASATALMGPVNVHANWPAFYYGIWVPGGRLCGSEPTVGYQLYMPTVGHS